MSTSRVAAPLYDVEAGPFGSTVREDGAPHGSVRWIGQTRADRLAEASARTASLQLSAARMRAGLPVDRTAVRTHRDPLRGRLDALDEASRWTESGRVILVGLRGRLDQIETV